MKTSFHITLGLVLQAACSAGSPPQDAPNPPQEPVDHTPLSLNVAQPSDGAFLQPGTLTVHGTASSGAEVLRVEVAFNGSGYVKATGTTQWSFDIDTTAVTEGTYDLLVRASDAANHLAMDKRTITIDGTAPTAVLIGAPASTTRQTHLHVNVAGAGVVAYRYSLDAAPYSEEHPSSQPIAHSDLAAGQHRLDVIARDAAGNWQSVDDATSAQWEIQLGPHLLSAIPAPGASLSNPHQVITLTFDQPIASVTLGGSMGELAAVQSSADPSVVRVAPQFRWWNKVDHHLDVYAAGQNSQGTTLALPYAFSDGMVYVDPEAGDDLTADGTQYAPFANIPAALASLPGHPLALVGGIYEVTENPSTHIDLPAGSGLWGGFAPVTYARDPSQFLTTIIDTREGDADDLSPHAAVFCSGAGRRTLHQLEVRGGSGQQNAALVLLDGCELTAEQAELYGGDAGQSAAVRNDGGYLTVAYSTMTGGDSETPTGLVQHSGHALVYNTLITGGAGDATHGLLCHGGAVQLLNTTLHAGTGSYSTAALQGADCTLHMANNIFFGDDTENSVGLRQAATESAALLTLRNNAFFGFAQVYYNEHAAAAYASMAAWPAELQDAGALVSGNIMMDPVLRSPGGQDGAPHTLHDNDWRLTPAAAGEPNTPCQVREGGLNGLAEGWPYTTDYRNGAQRWALLVCSVSMPDDAAGWSMGAYELFAFEE